MAETAGDDSGRTAAEWARLYASQGLRVLPIKPGEKRPPMTSWQKVATTDRKTIDGWWYGLYRHHGVGIATGPESGVWVLDVDNHGIDGNETLTDLEFEHGPLPATVEAVTGSNGRHLFFQYPDVKVGTTKNLGAGLDVRGEGGQVVACPTIHPNGNMYRWKPQRAPGEIPVAVAPKWLLDLVTVTEPPLPAVPATPPPGLPLATVTSDVDDSIAERINKTHTWRDLLERDGWQIERTMGADVYWTRPGKSVKLGASAIEHTTTGVLVVFTDAIDALKDPRARVREGEGWAYSLFGYLAATRFGGDRSACARQYRLDLNADQARSITYSTVVAAHGVLDDDEPKENIDDLLLAMQVDWSVFWQNESVDPEWLMEPFLALGRGTALYAKGGTGKSLLALWMAATIATGGVGPNGLRVPRRHVAYFDHEMTDDDVRERLEAMGFDSSRDMSWLHYWILPPLNPLDTSEGGRQITRLAEHVDAALVVIDTFSRAVTGDENDSKTVIDFYAHTGRALKAAGRGMLRIDHAGKDIEKGQRGSSAKNDDVDVAWQMSPTQDGFRLVASKRRMPWIPDQIIVEKHDEPLCFKVAQAALPQGTDRAIEALDQLDAPVQITLRAAIKFLTDAGRGVNSAAVGAAVKIRKSRIEQMVMRTNDPDMEGY